MHIDWHKSMLEHDWGSNSPRVPEMPSIFPVRQQKMFACILITNMEIRY